MVLKKLNFKFISAKNFLCFGPDGIEIDLEKLPEINVIKGTNFNNNNYVSSNGAGKSSLKQIVLYTLFSKTNRNLNNKDYIHKSGGKLRCEVQWDDYRVVREQTHNSHKVWLSQRKGDDWEDISAGSGTPKIQKDIEDRLGLNYKTFSSLILFDDQNQHCFLESSGPDKRVIFENLLSLDRYREYAKSAKNLLADMNRQLQTLTREYEHATAEHAACERRLAQIGEREGIWERGVRQALSELRARKDLIRGEMDQDDDADMRRFREAQEQIALLNDKVATLQASQVKVSGMLDEARSRHECSSRDRDLAMREAADLTMRVDRVNSQIEQHRRQVGRLQSLESGAICDRCMGVVDPKNALDTVRSIEAEIEGLLLEKASLEDEKRSVGERLKTITAEFEMAGVHVKAADAKSRELSRELGAVQVKISQYNNVKRPDASQKVTLLEQRLADLASQVDEKEKELGRGSPFVEIRQACEQELAQRATAIGEKKSEIAMVEGRVPYVKFWVEAFGDDGIRRFITERIVPTLNDQLSRWLDVLMDGHIGITFNQFLEESISRVPFADDPFVYSAMSGGERRRLNLAVLNAFAYILTLNSGACPNLLFLDEVAINIDASGVDGVYRMIRELARDRKVFVTTHDPLLLDLLQGHNTICLERRDGCTALVT